MQQPGTSTAESSCEPVTIAVDTSLYGEEALFRACYAFTDRCYLLLRRGAERAVLVDFRARDAVTELSQIVGQFENELIDQKLRADIRRETASVRNLIVRQAFAEARFDGGEY